jgi:hypothetical protein
VKRASIAIAAASLLWIEASFAAEAPARFTLRAASIESQSQEGGRFRVKARVSAVADAGELREGERFVALGRIGKSAAACAMERILRDGFEGS